MKPARQLQYVFHPGLTYLLNPQMPAPREASAASISCKQFTGNGKPALFESDFGSNLWKKLPKSSFASCLE